MLKHEMRGEKRDSNSELCRYAGRGGKGMGSRARGPRGQREENKSIYMSDRRREHNKLVVAPKSGKTNSEKLK